MSRHTRHTHTITHYHTHNTAQTHRHTQRNTRQSPSLCHHTNNVKSQTTHTHTHTQQLGTYKCGPAEQCREHKGCRDVELLQPEHRCRRTAGGSGVAVAARERGPLNAMSDAMYRCVVYVLCVRASACVFALCVRVCEGVPARTGFGVSMVSVCVPVRGICARTTLLKCRYEPDATAAFSSV